MLIFLAKETRATTFWQLPRLPWLIESDSEHMHTHRHTPTHTVGGERQAHMHRDAGRQMDRELARHRQMCLKCNSYIAICYYSHNPITFLKKPLYQCDKSRYHLKCYKYFQHPPKKCFIPNVLLFNSQPLARWGLLKIDWLLSTLMILLCIKEKCHLQTFFMYSHSRTKFSLVATEVLRPVFDWCAVARVVFGWDADCGGFWQCSLQISCSK